VAGGSGEDVQITTGVSGAIFQAPLMGAVLTNTNAQIQYSTGSGAQTSQIFTAGWIDPHLAPVW
jgi:hypothetical protein